MHEPFTNTKKWHPCDHSNKKPMDGCMRREPPLPTQGDIAARALLHSHAIVLQAEITEKVAHGQQSEKFRAGAGQHP